MSDRHDGIVERFRREFEACDWLYGFAVENRPQPATINELDGLILDTYARSSKTYQGVVRLAYLGYGEQALMLSRPLFEDMVVAHWLRRNPTEAKRLEEFRLLSIERLREKGHRHDLPDVLAQLPEPLSRERRDELKQKFSGNRHWTGLTLDAIVKAVEDEWPQKNGQRALLWQIYDFDCFNANHLIHHGHAGLNAGRVRRTTAQRSYNVGASPKHVREALRLAFFSYGNTIDLALTAEIRVEFSRLYSEHMLRAGFVRTNQ